MVATLWMLAALLCATVALLAATVPWAALIGMLQGRTWGLIGSISTLLAYALMHLAIIYFAERLLPHLNVASSVGRLRTIGVVALIPTLTAIRLLLISGVRAYCRGGALEAVVIMRTALLSCAALVTAYLAPIAVLYYVISPQLMRALAGAQG